MLTRDDDYDLSNPKASLRKRSDLYKRSQLINLSESDLYLSIHLNAESSGLWSGAQVFYDDVNSQNVEIAKILQNSLNTDLKTNRKYKEVSEGYLYQRVTVPGVLVEVGFLSNANERYLLRQDTYQYKVSNAIANGIEKYIYSIK